MTGFFAAFWHGAVGAAAGGLALALALAAADWWYDRPPKLVRCAVCGRETSDLAWHRAWSGACPGRPQKEQ